MTLHVHQQTQTVINVLKHGMDKYYFFNSTVFVAEIIMEMITHLKVQWLAQF